MHHWVDNRIIRSIQSIITLIINVKWRRYIGIFEPSLVYIESSCHAALDIFQINTSLSMSSSYCEVVKKLSNKDLWSLIMCIC